MLPKGCKSHAQTFLEAGLSVYEQLLYDETIENSTGDILLFKPVFVAPEHVFSNRHRRLAFAVTGSGHVETRSDQVRLGCERSMR